MSGKNNEKYTKEKLEEIAKNSFSIAQVIRALGLKEAGGTHSHVSRRLKQLNVDTSHFLGRAANCGVYHKGGKKLKPEDILILRTKGKRQQAYVLRRALVESGTSYECSECGISKWREKKLVLPVDHINGNWLDDRKENLRLLCPNCHSQSPKYCGSKGLTDIFDRRKGFKKDRETRKNKKSEWRNRQTPWP